MSPTRFSFVAILAVALLAVPARAQDVVGSKDHPLVGRYAGSVITRYQALDFDEQRFVDRPLDVKADGETLTDRSSHVVAGKVVRIRYDAPKDRSSLEIVRNYEESLKSKGFRIVWSCADAACFSPPQSAFRFAFVGGDGAINYRFGEGVRYLLAEASLPTGDVHVMVIVGTSKNPPLVRVVVVDAKPMEGGKIAFVDAGAMAQAIETRGRVALYGILFDFDAATPKPESRPTLDEIGKFLKARPSVSVVVTGHTDATGAFDYNVDLSRRRAAAVVEDLVARQGIAARRLTAFGAGMSSPVASNHDEAGRAENRRVELVER